jgi:hypothetical protein
MEYEKPILLDLGQSVELIKGSGIHPVDPDMNNQIGPSPQPPIIEDMGSEFTRDSE